MLDMCLELALLCRDEIFRNADKRNMVRSKANCPEIIGGVLYNLHLHIHVQVVYGGIPLVYGSIRYYTANICWSGKMNEIDIIEKSRHSKSHFYNVATCDMIAGDRKALKATLNHGITNILRRLVDLYAYNLNQLSKTTILSNIIYNCDVAGIQTSVLAGLAFNGAIQPNFLRERDGFGPRSADYAWVFSTLIQFAMITSFLSMVVSTLASQYGPSLALTGKSSKVVVYGARFHTDAIITTY